MTPTPTMIAPADVQAAATAAEQDARTFVQLNQIPVLDLASCQQAVTIRQRIAEKKAEIEAKLKEPKAWAFKLHRWFCSLENAAMKPLDDLDIYERGQIASFKDAQDRLRREREQAEADQRRREQEADAMHLAAAYETAGETALAEAVLAEALHQPPAIVVLPDVTKQVAGLKFTRRYLWRYTGGPKTLADTPPEIIARSLAIMPRDYLCVDEKKIGTYARSMKEAASIPGIEFYSVEEPVR